MKSIKPGRGPSMLGGISSILIGLFGVVWTIIAANIGGGLFAVFGVIFVIFAIVQAAYNFKNATGKNRYSTFDIADSSEESDPLNERFGAQQDNGRNGTEANVKSAFCPYCGTPVDSAYEYCNKCGKKLP